MHRDEILLFFYLAIAERARANQCAMTDGGRSSAPKSARDERREEAAASDPKYFLFGWFAVRVIYCSMLLKVEPLLVNLPLVLLLFLFSPSGKASD